MTDEARTAAPSVEIFSAPPLPPDRKRALEIAITGELERAIPDRTAAERFAEYVRQQAERELAFGTFRRIWRRLLRLVGD